MQNIPKEKNIHKNNYYKILFHKHDTLPVGHFSRNLINKIIEQSNDIYSLKEKNSEYFNPISDINAFKIQKIYSKFQRQKSANKYSSSNSNRKINKYLSRPLSQYSTLIDVSKNKNSYLINLKKNNHSKILPISDIRSYSAFLVDDKLNIFNANNLSKIEKENFTKNKNINEDNIYIKQNITKKNLEKRCSSAKLINQNIDVSKQLQIKNILKNEEQMKLKKKLLKGRLLTALSRHLVINKETFKNYNILYIDKEEEKKDNDNEVALNKKKSKHFHFTNSNSECFSKIRPTFRFEDYYDSPMELLKKYFTEEEINLLKSSPNYFGLNKNPFKNSDFQVDWTLLSKFISEEKKDDMNYQYTVRMEQENKKMKFNIEKENEKLKNIFKEIKKNKRKREPIKGKDFVSHYERDIEPDEGTVAYFDRKYNKYLYNKEKKMEKKINNLKFKKNRFEYLKNLRTKKLQEEKNIQRICNPIINVIKKNYMRANSNNANI